MKQNKTTRKIRKKTPETQEWKGDRERNRVILNAFDVINTASGTQMQIAQPETVDYVDIRCQVKNMLFVRFFFLSPSKIGVFPFSFFLSNSSVLVRLAKLTFSFYNVHILVSMAENVRTRHTRETKINWLCSTHTYTHTQQLNPFANGIKNAIK